MQSLSVQAVLIGSILAAGILVYLPFGLVAYGRLRLGGEAIAAPRATVDKLPAFAQRATWAHQNSFEAFTLFTAACLMAYVTGASESWVGYVAIAHLSARLLYSVFYIMNWPILRALMFGVSTLTTASLMLTSVQHVL